MKRKKVDVVAEVVASNKAKAYLLEKGWKPCGEGEAHRLYNEKRNIWKDRGGLNPLDALDVEREFERIEAGKPVYKWRWNVGQLGCIVQKHVVSNDEHHTVKSIETVFQHHDREEAKRVAEELNNDRVPEVETLGGTKILYMGYTDQHDYNSMLLLREKHGDYYYRVRNPDDYKRVCLYVVKQRLKEGYYADLEEIEVPQEPEISRETVAAFKEGPIKEAALREWDAYDRTLKANTSATKMAAILKKAVAGDALAACMFLVGRHGAQYEDMHLEDLTVITDEDIAGIDKKDDNAE